jgi:DNA-binding NarL/FixJ family response regulator
MIDEPVGVVLVDDHTLFAQTLAMALDSFDDIRICGRADKLSAGVALAGQHHPHVVLMDNRQPDGDGVAGAHPG